MGGKTCDYRNLCSINNLQVILYLFFHPLTRAKNCPTMKLERLKVEGESSKTDFYCGFQEKFIAFKPATLIFNTDDSSDILNIRLIFS